MTPLRTRNEIAMAVLPALDRQAPLDQDQFLELCQTNASGLWEQVVNTYGDLAEQIDQLQGDLAEEQLHT
jgi:arsenate reductase-like glutaredoxin family protein